MKKKKKKTLIICDSLLVIELKVDHVMKCLVQQNIERNIRLNHRTYSVGMQRMYP